MLRFSLQCDCKGVIAWMLITFFLHNYSTLQANAELFVVFNIFVLDKKNRIKIVVGMAVIVTSSHVRIMALR